MFDLNWQQLALATWQTIYMVFISAFIGIVLGIAIGLMLYFSHNHTSSVLGKCYHRMLNFIVNIGRSIPYIILMIAIIPFTRYLIGTTIGTNAAIVSLVLACTPFYARIAESALHEVPAGLLDASAAMGASTWQLISKVLIPEALPSLIKGGTLTIITLVSYSAMAGAVGGGGLGQLAINYGYQQFDLNVMLATVIILIVMVQCVQWLGDLLAGKRATKPIWLISIILWIACIISQISWAGTHTGATLTVGITSGTKQKVMQVAKQVAYRRYNLALKIKTFDDYNLPNEALASGDIDANIFQHRPFLQLQKQKHHYKIKAIAPTFIYPMAFFSKKINSLGQLLPESVVAIPNDPSNESRALLLLQKHGIIKLTANTKTAPTVNDITQNPYKLKFKLMAAAQIPRALPDIALGAVTNDFISSAGLNFHNAIIRESKDSPYANVIVVRQNDQNPLFNKLIKVMHSKPVLKATLKAFPQGAAVPAWHNIINQPHA